MLAFSFDIVFYIYIISSLCLSRICVRACKIYLSLCMLNVSCVKSTELYTNNVNVSMRRTRQQFHSLSLNLHILWQKTLQIKQCFTCHSMYAKLTVVIILLKQFEFLIDSFVGTQVAYTHAFSTLVD